MKKGFEVAILVVLFLVLAVVVFADLISEAVPTLNTVDVVAADTEYAYVMTGEVTSFTVECRQSSIVRYAFVTGKVAASTEPYLTLKSGVAHDWSGISWTNPTIYVASTTAGVSVEIPYEVAP